MVEQIRARKKRFIFLSGMVCLLFCGLILNYTPTGTAADGGKELMKEALTQGRPEAEKLKEKKEAADREKRLAEKTDVESASDVSSPIVLPDDTTAVLDVTRIEIRGNTLLTSQELFENIPSIYNSSSEKIEEANPTFLYDFSSVKAVLDSPGTSHRISARTIQGLTQYLLSVHKEHGFGGIYVYVPTETFAKEFALKDGVLIIKVLEAKAAKVTSNFFDVEGNPPEKEYLRRDLIEEWSPVKEGEPINQKELDDFLNLLNLNPDRYITATVSKGEKDETLNVDYNVYEVSPWHYFAQIDNAGTRDRRWTPRIGIINTNLTGRDDTFTAVLQSPIDDRASRNKYSLFASYDVPLFTPELRLNLFGGRSEFDVDGGAGIDFLGNGTIWGSNLTYNLLQQNDWFFDVFTGFSFEKSKVGSSLFSSQLGSDVRTDLWTFGAKLHKSDDMSKTFIGFDRSSRIGGSGQDAYWNSVTQTGSRTNAESNFWIWNFNATHFRYLEAEKIQRVLASVRYIQPNRRLISSKMTTFGGMYSVRGYEESAIVADGGILASFQYEYDLVKHGQAKAARENEPRERTPSLRKFAPLVFFDYGRAKVKDSVPGENAREELYSLGGGFLFEYGKRLSGGAYYGYPFKASTGTATGDGRINIFVMLQW